MPRLVKIAVWVVVFSAAAGAGALVAAHTDPFPPGVDDPGVRPTGPGPGEIPDGRLSVRIDARTFHDLYVGGRCAANWRTVVDIGSAEDSLDRAGIASLKGQLRCDEPTAQVQAERIDLRVVGAMAEGELRFRLELTGRTPFGSQELSGFAKTIPTLRFELPAREGATASFDITVPDGDRGTYGAVGGVLVGAAQV
jgi:hypothetical protein